MLRSLPPTGPLLPALRMPTRAYSTCVAHANKSLLYLSHMAAKKASPKTIACYCRVSSSSQENDSQRSEIRRWLRGSGIKASAVEWFEDKESS